MFWLAIGGGYLACVAITLAFVREAAIASAEADRLSKEFAEQRHRKNHIEAA